MNAAVLLVGDELLAGFVSDRNAAAVARALAPRGVRVQRVETCGDDEGAIREAAARLAREHGLLVVCGGLGGTPDDRTRDALVEFLGPHAEAVANPVGSASGVRGDVAGCRVWVLPGVPEEARVMAEELAEGLADIGEGRAWELVVATAGAGETALARRLAEAGFQTPGDVALAFLPSPGGVQLRLSARGAPVPRSVLEEQAGRLREILGENALPEATLAESLVRALEGRGGTLATAESCTGGLLGAGITDVPGASSVYLGGTVTYSDRAKTERLGVPAERIAERGAVSREVCTAMAEGAREAFSASLAVSVTGVAGPAGGSPEKPVGTVWIGVCDAAGTAAEVFRFSGTRAMVRERAVNKALEMAYRRWMAG